MTSQETDIPQTSQLGEKLVRRAEGEKLFAVLKKLAPLNAHELVELPVDEMDRPDPWIALARNRELAANRERLRSLVDDSDDFLPRLISRVPEAVRPIEDVVVTGAFVNEPKKNTDRWHYISLLFDKDTTRRLGQEQIGIWQGMQAMVEQAAGPGEAVDRLNWGAFNPRMLAVAVGADMPNAADHIHAHLERATPFNMTLRPLGEPRRP